MKFLNGIIYFGLAMVLVGLGIAALDDCHADEKVDDELIAAQPWLIDRPEEEVVEVEEPPVDDFWGYEYTPIVITWYGKYVPKKKHELEPFREFGAQASSVEVQQQCEDKIDELETILKASTDTQFAFVVTCLGRYIVKVVEEEK